MAHHHDALYRLLTTNSQWALDVEDAEPDFFSKCAEGQSPSVLWIGCADSRVPESVITGARPGDIFVHRNIANQFHLDDASAQAVLTYAVDHLGVEHVVIVGHSECGGAAACFQASLAPTFDASTGPVVTVPSSTPDAAINVWLAPLTKLASTLKLSSTPKAEALPVVVEENVKQQVANLAQSETIQNAWATKSLKGKDVWIHGWVYDIASGRLRDLNVTQGPKPAAR
ncbi:hypothetical protein HGRIS_012881 [Hohenbuehelia grisea]|uniref:Carbonic anhydrase n=1 Tax=Hohenbuehelia grisea TaxID=104357 RepID=A0ABR3ITV2_9AGAR